MNTSWCSSNNNLLTRTLRSNLRSMMSNATSEVSICHSSTANIHQYLMNGKHWQVEKMYKNGKLFPCVGTGTNCFVLAMKFCGLYTVKLLLKCEPNGIHSRNQVGETILMSQMSDLKNVEELLQLGAEVLVTSNDKSTPLMFLLAAWAEQDPTNTKEMANSMHVLDVYLTGYGFDASSPDIKGENLVVHAVKNSGTFYGPLLEAVVLGGADPTVKSSYALDLAIKNFMPSLLLANEDLLMIKVQALDYLFRLPHFFCIKPNELGLWNSRDENHPQFQIFGQNSMKFLKMIISGHFDFILTKRFLNSDIVLAPSMVLTAPPTRGNLEKAYLLNVNVIGYYFNIIQPDCSELQLCYSFLQKFMALDFITLPAETRTPLLLICLMKPPAKATSVTFATAPRKTSKRRIEDCDVMLDIVKFLIREHDVIEYQQVLRPRENSMLHFLSYHMGAGDTIQFPDAVYIAFAMGHVQTLRYLLPHFSVPALSLMVTCNDSLTISVMYPVLVEWGPLPHGTEIFKIINENLKSWTSMKALSPAIYKDFCMKHKSPHSLAYLSKCVVRKSLAQEAFRTGRSLPAVMSEMSPDLKLSSLTPPNLNNLAVVVCDNEELANLSQEFLSVLVSKRPEPSDYDVYPGVQQVQVQPEETCTRSIPFSSNRSVLKKSIRKPNRVLHFE